MLEFAAGMIVFDNVTFARGAREILRGLTFTVGPGETLALVGRSGAGKSTALKLIIRLLEPTAGRVLVEGRDTREWNPFTLRRRTGYVLQEVGLFPHLTVEENVGLVPSLEQWPGPRRAARVRELLTLVGLHPADFASRWPDELSGGQRQRVGVARALGADPPVLLMDEPFGALDPVTRSEMHREFRRIQEQVRKTIVLVTHDMAEAFTIASRVGVVAEGRLVALDSPQAIAKSTDDRVRPLLAPLLEARAAVRPLE
jgi:osmoprotectant transport system ATP-binding protein